MSLKLNFTLNTLGLLVKRDIPNLHISTLGPWIFVRGFGIFKRQYSYKMQCMRGVSHQSNVIEFWHCAVCGNRRLEKAAPEGGSERATKHKKGFFRRTRFRFLLIANRFEFSFLHCFRSRLNMTACIRVDRAK